MIANSFVYTEQPEQFCPNCRCDINKYLSYVGTTTVTACSGNGSRQERESYFKLYGELMYEVPHYTFPSVRIFNDRS